MFRFRIAIFLLIPWVTCALAQASNVTINKEEQQARDTDRHLILRTELTSEYQALAKAQMALTAVTTAEQAVEVHRRTENIKALQREIAAVASQQMPRELIRVTPKARRAVTGYRAHPTPGAATFWNPYNRASDPEAPSEFPTTP
jgi:flagellar capping protein FliD